MRFTIRHVLVLFVLLAVLFGIVECRKRVAVDNLKTSLFSALGVAEERHVVTFPQIDESLRRLQESGAMTKGVEMILQLATHPESEVRLKVAYALRNLEGKPSQKVATVLSQLRADFRAKLA